jgi:hypothetical protein
MATVVVLLMMLLLGGGFVALVVLLLVRAAKQAQQRREGLAAYAAHREWEYAETDPSLVGRFGGAPFGRGFAGTASNVLRGRHDGRAFVAFDYSYRDTSGVGDDRQTNTYRFSVVALHLGVRTPGLSVAPTGMFGKLVNAVTGRDIPIGVPAFDQAFTVTTPAPEFARDVLHPAVLEVQQHHPGLAWRLDGDSMLVIRNGQHAPQEIEGKLHFMDAVLDRIPAHVWDRLRGEQPR